MSRPTGHRARKRFGQNFLTDPQVVNSIIHAINPQSGQAVIEIGPGLGALTEQLLRASGGTLTAIELDRDLVPVLRTQFAGCPGFTVHEADALTFDFASLAAPDQQLRIVGNLPYNISTALLFHLLSFTPQIKDMHFMLQKEVVARLAAVPGTKAYGRLSIMVQYHCQVEPLLTVPPGAFKPKPKVDSAVVRLTPYRQPPVPVKDLKQLERLLRKAFGQRRKTIRNNLKGILSPATLEALGIDPELRPEHLTLQMFAAISDTLTSE